MRRIQAALAVLALVTLAGQGIAAQTQSLWVSDNGGGLSLTPVVSTSGVVTYVGNDSFWSIVISDGVAYPPMPGQGSLSYPVMDLLVTATSLGGAGASLHPLNVTFAASDFGPSVASFHASLTGQLVSGAGQFVAFDTFYDPANHLVANPTATVLTHSGDLLNYNGAWNSTALGLPSPYALTEVLSIQANDAAGATYSLDASLVAVPEPAPVAFLLGAALFGLNWLRRKAS